MTNSNPSPYQIPENQGQPQNPPFTPVPDSFKTPPPYQQSPYQNAGNPFANGSLYQQQSPYQNVPQVSSEYNLPAELNPRDKEEYFRMWRDFSWIPRPAVIWWGGLLAAIVVSAPFSWNDVLYDMVSSVTFWAWIIFGIVGTLNFKQGIKQIFSFSPHLATSEKKMIEMRKVARLRVGYTYKDTFSNMWHSLKNLLTGIFSSNPTTSANAPVQNGATPYSGYATSVPQNSPEGYVPPAPYGNVTQESTNPASSSEEVTGNPAPGYSAPQNGLNLKKPEDESN